MPWGSRHHYRALLSPPLYLCSSLFIPSYSGRRLGDLSSLSPVPGYQTLLSHALFPLLWLCPLPHSKHNPVSHIFKKKKSFSDLPTPFSHLLSLWAMFSFTAKCLGASVSTPSSALMKSEKALLFPLTPGKVLQQSTLPQALHPIIPAFFNELILFIFHDIFTSTIHICSVWMNKKRKETLTHQKKISTYQKNQVNTWLIWVDVICFRFLVFFCGHFRF